MTLPEIHLLDMYKALENNGQLNVSYDITEN